MPARLRSAPVSLSAETFAWQSHCNLGLRRVAPSIQVPWRCQQSRAHIPSKKHPILALATKPESHLHYASIDLYAVHDHVLTLTAMMLSKYRSGYNLPTALQLYQKTSQVHENSRRPIRTVSSQQQGISGYGGAVRKEPGQPRLQHPP